MRSQTRFEIILVAVQNRLEQRSSLQSTCKEN